MAALDSCSRLCISADVHFAAGVARSRRFSQIRALPIIAPAVHGICDRRGDCNDSVWLTRWWGRMADAEFVTGSLADIGDPAFLLQTLFTEAPVAFAVARADGRCLLVNRVFRELFGAVPPPDYNMFRDE